MTVPSGIPQPLVSVHVREAVSDHVVPTMITCALSIHHHAPVPFTIYVHVPFTVILAPVDPLLQLYSVHPLAIKVVVPVPHVNDVFPLIVIANPVQSILSQIPLLFASTQHVPPINSSPSGHASHVQLPAIICVLSGSLSITSTQFAVDTFATPKLPTAFQLPHHTTSYVLSNAPGHISSLHSAQ